MFERLRGVRVLARETDKKMDVYSFGVTLFELVTGQVAWPAGRFPRGAPDIIDAVRRGERPVPETEAVDRLKSLGGESCLEIYRRCVRADPNERPVFSDLVRLLTPSINS